MQRVLCRDNQMGYEYNFKITQQDIDNLSRHPDGIDNLDKLLRLAPYFTEYSDSTYYYIENKENKDRWPSNILIQDYGFCLCIYDGSSGSKDLEIMDYLIYELLHRCGRVEVEG
jgi:hypothetical protein